MIKDFNGYNLKMTAAMNDKLFFVNKIDLKSYDLIVDFGCATGELLRRLLPYINKKEKVQLVGYDISEEMLSVARTNVPGEGDNFETDLVNSREGIMWHLRNCTKSLIIFSSVLHEIDAVTQRKLIRELMPYFDTIVIRDMKRPFNNEPIDALTRKRVLKQVAPWQAQMFESKWGKIRDKETLYRFFLMNEFVENFEREVEEDYFSVLWSEIDWALEGDYTIWSESFILPYRREQVKKRFNHTMHDITHRKAIYNKMK